ncbi:diaminopimelate epimerase [Candidatus Acidulodesulfobacterium sp. H_13]|uniref:diaminopimelate epimerase n=1 Tax=Candidatus Acidulodesulfobacterium sp. H_13 TaxID=3395470 RepID=UPI003AF6C3B4
MNIKFTKLHGAGNDYLYIDAMNDLPDPISNNDTNFYKELAIKISDRHFGVGSDGIIIILPPSAKARKDSDVKADFRMRVFNVDGSEGEMCGNGIRCFAKYVYDYNLINEKTINIETLAGIKIVELFLSSDVVMDVKVFMGFPAFKTDKIPAYFKKSEIILEKLTVGGMDFDISCVSMGNPHCVIFVNDVKGLDVGFYGPLVENDKLFPKKVNVEFVQVQDPKNVLVRTWERGSGETLACGTGACAVYSVMKKIGKIKQNGLNVNLYGGTLKISGELTDGIYMTGPAEEVFTGYYNFTYK